MPPKNKGRVAKKTVAAKKVGAAKKVAAMKKTLRSTKPTSESTSESSSSTTPSTDSSGSSNRKWSNSTPIQAFVSVNYADSSSDDEKKESNRSLCLILGGKKQGDQFLVNVKSVPHHDGRPVKQCQESANVCVQILCMILALVIIIT
jgi:hypothetical protein